MSRIGKKPVVIPDKVQVTISGNELKVKGPNGNLSKVFNKNVSFVQETGAITVTPCDMSQTSRSMWGMTRTLVANMVTGVTTGFTKVLEFNGVGYKAAVSGSKLTLNLGYSHQVDYELPSGISAKVVKNQIELSGSDKELVGFVAAKIRSFRPPEPYKGKGIKYIEEVILRKAGKTGGKK